MPLPKDIPCHRRTQFQMKSAVTHFIVSIGDLGMLAVRVWNQVKFDDSIPLNIRSCKLMLFDGFVH